MAAGEENLIDFEVIEGAKENIQALPSGRSAKSLAQIFSPVAQRSPANTQDIHDAARQEFEKELRMIDDCDDPLDVYDRYVKWTLDAYPTAQATPSSQLLPLLERATKAFVAAKQYKNDPRYVRIWLHYIRFFSDAPRETFAYLARHGIGESLALYYEEFAAWLETAGRWNQAEEVYKMGIEHEAQPGERLMRRFHDFEQRYQAQPQEAREPSSPALPTVRPALAAKFDPHSSTSPSGTVDPQAASRAQSQAKTKKGKIAIFADGGEEARPASNSSAQGWENIGSLAERKKENVISAKPWQGETLPTGVTRMGVPKMAVFKDELLARLNGTLHRDPSLALAPNHLVREQSSRNARTGKLEHIVVDLRCVYPNPTDPTEEYTLEEIWLARQGLRFPTSAEPAGKWVRKQRTQQASLSPEGKSPNHRKRSFEIAHDETLNIALQPQVQPGAPGKKGRAFEIAQDDTATLAEHVKIVSKQQSMALNDLGVNDENAENVDPQQAPAQGAQKPSLAQQMRREEKANRTRKIMVKETSETQTVQTNLDSPSKPKIKRRRTKEATMTLHTKAATDEVYELFNAPLRSEMEQESEAGSEGESSSDEDDDDDDYASVCDSTTGRISVGASDYGDETRDVADGEATETNNTGWTDFDPLDAHSHDSEDDESTSHTHETTHETSTSHADTTGHSDAIDADSDEEDIEDAEAEPIATDTHVATPTSPTPAEDAPRTRYIPMPPDDYYAPTHPYRTEEMVAQSRLPFMTPIVELTESSIGTTSRFARGREEQSAKTPCPKQSQQLLIDLDDHDDDDAQEDGDSHMTGSNDEICSSPFTDEVLHSPAPVALEPLPKLKMLKPQAEKPLTVRPRIESAAAPKTTARQKEQRGPIIKDAQVNPMDPTIRNTILSEMQPPLESYGGYFAHTGQTCGRRAELKRFARAVAAKKDATIPSQPSLVLPMAKRQYTVKRQLGAGAYAPVYLVDSTDTAQEELQGAFDTRQLLEAVKSEDPPSAWEFYMLACAHRRLGVTRAAASVVRAHEMHMFEDECYLVEDYRPTGTVLDLINAAGDLGVAGSANCGSGSTTAGAGVDETLAMFLAVELLRTVEALHSKQLIHGDLKPDNVLLRLDPSTPHDDHPSGPFSRDGSSGWAAKGIMLIDLGRGIDARQFAPTTTFVADWPTTATDCAEMREARPWTYHIDYFGLAGILHVLLFGRYIETVADKGGAILGGGVKTYRLREPLKRYWQTELWAECFGVLLNPAREVSEGGRLPVEGALRRVREQMEGWLEGNAERGIGLRGLLRRVEGGVRRRG